MDVSELTQRTAVTCRTGTAIRDVADEMARQNVGCLVIVDEHGRLAGIVTDRDIAVRAETFDQQVDDVMSREVSYVYCHEDVLNVATRIATLGKRRLPTIAADGSVVGMVTVDDLLVLFSRQIDKLSRAVGREIAAPLPR